MKAEHIRSARAAVWSTENVDAVPRALADILGPPLTTDGEGRGGEGSQRTIGRDMAGSPQLIIYSLIGTAKLNDIDPQAWLAEILARIADTPQSRLGELLPWNWRAVREPGVLAA